jgi:hypothetical protein
MPIEGPTPRGTVIGERVGGPVHEALHYFKCPLWGGNIDARDLTWVEDHEGGPPHPASDQALSCHCAHPSNKKSRSA